VEHLQQHSLTHNRLKTVKCEECGTELLSKTELKYHLRDVCLRNKTKQEGDLTTGQLDFVALLSSVGEEVVTSDGLHCPEYEISSQPLPPAISPVPPTIHHSEDILATSLALNNLQADGEGEMLQLMQVGPQVLRIEDVTGTGGRTLLLRPLPAKENTGQTSFTNSFVPCQTNKVMITTSASGPSMSEGLETLDTSAISSPQQQGTKRARTSEGDFSVRSKIRVQEWQPVADHGASVTITPSTINLQDLNHD
jgi:hypothetical protein